jgi:hypothetical protein
MSPGPYPTSGTLQLAGSGRHVAPMPQIGSVLRRAGGAGREPEPVLFLMNGWFRPSAQKPRSIIAKFGKDEQVLCPTVCRARHVIAHRGLEGWQSGERDAPC